MNEDIEYGTILNSSNFEKMDISEIDNTHYNYFYKFNFVYCFCYNFDKLRIYCKNCCIYMNNLHYILKLYTIVLIIIFIFLMDRIFLLNIFTK